MIASTEKKKVPILMYHSISYSTTPRFKQFTVSPDIFAEQMAYLYRHSYSPITVSQFVRALFQGEASLPERPVVLTFDDGFADFFTEAFPVLQHYGYTATLFVTTAFIDGTSRWLGSKGEASHLMLTWDQLIEASAHGIECGAHSHNHRQLDTLPLFTAQDEIVRSKRLLEYHLGKEVLSFAYPFGYHTATIRRLVREAGYTSGCAVKYSMSSETTDPFALARLMVRANTNVDDLAAMLTGQNSLSLTKMYLRTRTPVWQIARRSATSVTRYLKKDVLTYSHSDVAIYRAQRHSGNAVSKRKVVDIMTDMKLDVSVIICAFTEERWHDLVAAVESIQQQNVPPREIIVVIDHNPCLLERVRSDIPGVIAVENIEPQGLSGARNSGIAVAHGSFIAFLDDDAIAEPDWLAKLSQRLADPQILGVGGTVMPLWLDSRPAWFPEEFYWVVGCTYRGLSETEEPVVVRNPFGGCTCYRREVFEVVGGFRDGIGRIGTRPMGGEETELCIRAQQHWPQKVFLYEPQARIHHRIPFHRARWHYFQSRCYAEGLSKAVITSYVGKKDSLASERTYTLQTLPKGVVRGLMDSLFRFDLTGLMRAGAIIVGFAMTMTGYLVGTITPQLASRKKASINASTSPQTFTVLNNKELTTIEPKDTSETIAYLQR